MTPRSCCRHYDLHSALSQIGRRPKRTCPIVVDKTLMWNSFRSLCKAFNHRVGTLWNHFVLLDGPYFQTKMKIRAIFRSRHYGLCIWAWRENWLDRDVNKGSIIPRACPTRLALDYICLCHGLHYGVTSRILFYYDEPKKGVVSKKSIITMYVSYFCYYVR